jgi:hypothetical protein
MVIPLAPEVVTEIEASIPMAVMITGWDIVAGP